MKTIRIDTARQLLDDLSERSTEPLDHAGFGYMSELINETIGQQLISQKYLYENLFKKVEKLGSRADASLRLSLNKLDAIARYLGFRNFSELEHHYEQPVSPIVKSCLGTWLCYVRRNTSRPVILMSPVQISMEGQKVAYRLKGPTRHYNGSLQHHAGCLFCHFESPDGKRFQHVYKVGSCMSPEVLQGVFSGVSSAFDPIGGRVVLVRTQASFDTLVNRQYALNTTSPDPDLDENIHNYFRDYCDNNLMIKPAITFTEDDLY